MYIFFFIKLIFLINTSNNIFLFKIINKLVKKYIILLKFLIINFHYCIKTKLYNKKIFLPFLLTIF